MNALRNIPLYSKRSFTCEPVPLKPLAVKQTLSQMNSNSVLF